MRIAFVVPALTEGGGVPEVARFLLRTAGAAGADCRIVSLESASRSPLGSRLLAPGSWRRGVQTRSGEWEGHAFTEVGAAWSEFEFQRYRPRSPLTRLIADCDVVQVVCGSAAWANSVLGCGRRVSVHVATRAKVERRRRDAALRGPAGLWRRAMTPLTDRFDAAALRRADAVQVMNPWMLDYARGLNAQRAVDIRIAPPGVDAAMFCPAPLRTAAGGGYIFCVGRLDDPRKQVELLLEAYALLPPDVRAAATLKLAGSSAPAPAFWRRAQALGLDASIDFVHKPDRAALVRLYQGASAFALPSDEEGFGMVLLEAMACGVPVVSTRSGGPDAIVSDGDDGFLVARGDAAALADRLQRLSRAPALNDAMGRAARTTVERRYAEAVAGKVFVDVWERLAAGRRPHA